ncbi:PH domain-containing protein [Paractinoplanes ferrugineus]|uniref:Membrane protein n=1 Tax=Paractinoplanes ferrugineus TaxID=113564 RepID=A0A919MBP0_9ACTN|nr:PH domain-containing protein [Actinoplanes ferrugineus]GIE08629.1 membrane protein [Actinoplanes ferrugineus]
MAFPDEVLTEAEEVVFHLHPHGKTAIRPGLVALLALATTILSWVMLPQNNGGYLAFSVVALIMGYYGIRYGVIPLVIWRCTHYVVTTERVLLQDGVLARERRDLPLNRIDNHLMTQSLLDRVFGAGTLTIESIGDQAAVLAGVPRANQVQTALYEVIEQDRLRNPEDYEDGEPEDEPEVPPQRKRGGLFRGS